MDNCPKKWYDIPNNRAICYKNRKNQKRGRKVSMINEMAKRVELERYATKALSDLGVPTHLKGYHYIRESNLISQTDMEALNSITKLLYPEIARIYKTSIQKVERAIRNAIWVSWTRGNPAIIEKLFGYSDATGKVRPTNSEYIARLTDKICLDYKAVSMAS